MRVKFCPITRQQGGNFQKHCYNDARLASKSIELLRRMVSSQSNVVHQLSENAGQEKSFYRFLSNDRVSPGAMIDQLYRPSISKMADREIVVIGDSSEVSLKSRISSLQDKARVGVLSDNKTPGFYLHSHLVLDAQSGHGLGLSDLQLWMRKKSNIPKDQARKKDKRLWSEKETYCWMQGIIHSEEVLADVKSTLYVFDSEADMANLWASAKGARYDLLIRSQQHNRSLANSELKLYDFLQQQPISGSYQLALSKLDRRNYSRNKPQNRTKRIAQMEVRFSALRIKLNCESGKIELPLYGIDAREREDSVPAGEAPVHWRLLTTRPIETFEQAMEMIQFYEWRWQTEQLYRTAKKKGFGIEQTELTTLNAVLKQSILSLEAAFRVMRLVISRDKDSQQSIEDIFSPDEIQCLKVLHHKYEGKTEKLQNPWPEDQLAWAAWVIARLGGWKGYQSRKPPGPIRMKRGLDKFNTYFDAWNLFRTVKDVGEP